MTDAIERLPGLSTCDPAVSAACDRARQAARLRMPVLVTGETGTGKELVARALHELSPRAGRRLVAVNCAAIPETLAEAELFGVERGAFTSADRSRAGLLSEADGTTLFLDEVCSTPVPLQAKFLRVLDSGEFCRVGSTRAVSVDIRFVAAASRPYRDLVSAGVLRLDFLQRLAVCRLHLSPLRERRDDILLLAEYFLARFAPAETTPKTLDPAARRVLLRHEWPGNVRELRGAMESLAGLVNSPRITADDVHAEINDGARPETAAQRVARLLEAHGWNVSAAARALGVSRTTLYAWMGNYGLVRARPTAPAGSATCSGLDSGVFSRCSVWTGPGPCATAQIAAVQPLRHRTVPARILP